jgi:hypothetical protein
VDVRVFAALDPEVRAFTVWVRAGESRVLTVRDVTSAGVEDRVRVCLRVAAPQI